MKWKPPVGLVLWPASVAVVLAVAFAGIGKIEHSAAGVLVARVAIQPAMLVGTQTPHGPPALPAVIASVKAALRGAPIPTPLVPSLSALPKDIFGQTPGCSGTGTGQTSSSICYLAGPTAARSSTPIPGRKTLVVLGDSHAAMWSRPLLEMAQKDDWDVVPMWKADCSPSALYADVAGSAVGLAECKAWFKWALETIPSLHPSAVFISFLDVYGTPEVATKAESGISSLLGWAKTISGHVVLMLDSPLQTSLPLPGDCLTESGATLRTCTGGWGGGPFDSSPALRAIARRHHVGVIDPIGWFCYKRLCPLVIGHTIAFADYGHVTLTYATALGPPFRTAFRAALHTR